MAFPKKSTDVVLFKKLVGQGLNVKQIAKIMDHTDNNFGLKMKAVLGMYPSVFISHVKYGKIKLD